MPTGRDLQVNHCVLHIVPEGPTDQILVSDVAYHVLHLSAVCDKTMMEYRQEEKMNKKLYVGGLAYSVTDDQLRDLFATHGSVESASVVRDRGSDSSRGFGFVEMGTQQEAEKAIAALNATEFQGRSLSVNIAKPREPRSGGSRDRW